MNNFLLKSRAKIRLGRPMRMEIFDALYMLSDIFVVFIKVA